MADPNSVPLFITTGLWGITGLIFVSIIWEWLTRSISTWPSQPLGQFLEYTSRVCAAAAGVLTNNRGEWGVVIREPPQAQYAPTLVGLPAELTDMIVAFCEPLSRNVTQHAGTDDLFEDRLHRDGKRRIISGPSMLGLARTNRQLRYFLTMHLYKNKVLCLRHEDVEMTLEFLAEMYPSARDGIRGLHVEWQRTKPIDHKAFRRLCGVLDNMPKLSILRLTIPVNARKPYPAILDPGLWNALGWHKCRILWHLGYAFEIVRGFGFTTSRRASWVQHLLSIRGTRSAGIDGLQDFQLETHPRAGGAGLRTWLDSKMTLGWEDKVAAIQRIKRDRSWVSWVFLQMGVMDRLYDLYYIFTS